MGSSSRSHLQPYSPAFSRLVQAWSGLLTRAAFFDRQLRVSRPYSSSFESFYILLFVLLLLQEQSYAQGAKLRASAEAREAQTELAWLKEEKARQEAEQDAAQK